MDAGSTSLRIRHRRRGTAAPVDAGEMVQLRLEASGYASHAKKLLRQSIGAACPVSETSGAATPVGEPCLWLVIQFTREQRLAYTGGQMRFRQAVQDHSPRVSGYTGVRQHQLLPRAVRGHRPWSLVRRARDLQGARSTLLWGSNAAARGQGTPGADYAWEKPDLVTPRDSCSSKRTENSTRTCMGTGTCRNQKSLRPG